MLLGRIDFTKISFEGPDSFGDAGGCLGSSEWTGRILSSARSECKFHIRLEFNIFLKVVATVKERTDERFIPESYVSGKYLRRCFERKGGESDGFIASFHENYARFGKKKNTPGSPGYWFPRKFLQITLNTAIIDDR